MTTAQTIAPSPTSAGDDAPITVHPGSRVALSGITWETYERLRDDLDRSGCHRKLAYDGGDLEIEMPSPIHNLIKKLASLLIESFVVETRTRWLAVGQTTHKRKLLRKGIEADDAYYISKVDQVHIDKNTDPEDLPPPDIAVEVEVTNALVDKLPVHAALGVGELWHVNDEGEVRILRLEDEHYVEVSTSRELPKLTPQTLEYWIKRGMNEDHLTLVEEFRRILAEQ